MGPTDSYALKVLQTPTRPEFEPPLLPELQHVWPVGTNQMIQGPRSHIAGSDWFFSLTASLHQCLPPDSGAAARTSTKDLTTRASSSCIDNKDGEDGPFRLNVLTLPRVLGELDRSDRRHNKPNRPSLLAQAC